MKLTQEQKQIRKAVRDFVKGEFKKEVIDELVETRTFPEKILSKAADLGFIGIQIPERFDGEGLGYQEQAIIAEELAKGHSTLGAGLALTGYGADLLLFYGSDEQKKTWLPGIARGEILSAPVFEDKILENMGAQKEIRAVREGRDWIITGTRSLVVNGRNRAALFLVPCDTGAEPRATRFFLVPAGTKGVELKDPGKGLGLSLVPISRVFFDKVRIPETNMIDTGKGEKNKIEDLVVACSLGLSSLLVGTAQGAFDRALVHVKQRQQFGKKLVQFQITRHKLAAMATQIDMARLLVRRAAVALDTGKNKVKDCAMARLAAGRAAVEVCDEALQLFGGYGYIREYEIEAYYRDAKMLELLSGGPRAVKNTLADQIIK